MKFKDILKKIRQNSFSERDKGTKFEVLIKNWFLSDKLYCDNIKKIWLWEEFPYKDQLGGKDTGIDLVILTEEDEYWAIQCKCYDETTQISKKDIDTFISTSSKHFEVENETVTFSSRLFISTDRKSVV